MANDTPPDWTSPAELRRQLRRRWERGDILRARLGGDALFPLSLRLRKPRGGELGENFAAVADWVEALRTGAQRHGYRIHWRAQRNRVHGRNELPDAVCVDSEADALRWLGETDAAARFSQLADASLATFPTLRPWLAKHPLRLLEHAAEWPDLLTVLGWFQTHPRPGLYLRELDIPGIHTKFIERHRGLLAELLDAVLPEAAIDPDATRGRGFNRRYGLRDKPPRVRLRMLDRRLAVHGLTDLAVPVSELAGFDPGGDRVFVTENEINGLAFPDVPGALVIFGLGYGVDVLAGLPWLEDKRIHYWGDIDTHGFAILNRFRHAFPGAQSLLMDRATLQAHRPAWGREAEHKRFSGELDRLNDSEQTLFQALKHDQLAPALRLEQEHVRQGWLQAALRVCESS